MFLKKQGFFSWRFSWNTRNIHYIFLEIALLYQEKYPYGFFIFSPFFLWEFSKSSQRWSEGISNIDINVIYSNIPLPISPLLPIRGVVHHPCSRRTACFVVWSLSPSFSPLPLAVVAEAVKRLSHRTLPSSLLALWATMGMRSFMSLAAKEQSHKPSASISTKSHQVPISLVVRSASANLVPVVPVAGGIPHCPSSWGRLVANTPSMSQLSRACGRSEGVRHSIWSSSSSTTRTFGPIAICCSCPSSTSSTSSMGNRLWSTTPVFRLQRLPFTSGSRRPLTRWSRDRVTSISDSTKKEASH